MAKERPIYTKDFIQAVKRELPELKEMHRLLEDPRNERDIETVGRELLESCSGDLFSVPAQQIIKMIDDGQITELREEAVKILRIRKLHQRWSELRHRYRK